MEPRDTSYMGNCCISQVSFGTTVIATTQTQTTWHVYEFEEGKEAGSVYLEQVEHTVSKLLYC